MVIGGLAARLWGSPTYARDPANTNRLSDTMTELQATLSGVDDDDPLLGEHGPSFTFTKIAGSLDIVGLPARVKGFDELAANAVPAHPWRRAHRRGLPPDDPDPHETGSGHRRTASTGGAGCSRRAVGQDGPAVRPGAVRRWLPGHFFSTPLASGGMVYGPGSWGDLYRVGCDLSDVEGTPGLTADGLVTKVADVVGGEPHNVGGEGSPFIYGQAATAGPDAANRLVAGFLGEQDQNELTAQTLATFQSATGTHVVVQQQIRGAEVTGARYRVHFRADDGTYALTGRPVGDLADRDPGEPPSTTTEADAMAATRTEFGLNPDIPLSVERVVFPTEGQAEWAWQVRGVIDDPPGNLRAFFSASDLKVLVSYNIASSSLFGEGEVYLVNPRRTPDLSPVALTGLGPQPSDTLIGGQLNISTRVGAPATNPLRFFALGPDDPGFDQVQAWHHLAWGIQWFRALLQGTIMDQKPFSPLYAIVRDVTAPGNSFYVPDSNTVRLGDFGPRPAARSADVVLHELGHAVSDSICRLGRSVKHNTDARAMSEGYSDYFSASALDDPRVGDYVVDVDEGLRNLSKPDLRFAGAPPEEHQVGEVWGAVLWDLRTVLGSWITDLLAAESLQYLGPEQSLQEGCQALVQADRLLFPADAETGRHEEQITGAFNARQ